MIAINVKGDLKPLQKAFINLRSKQVPFATALALTRLAQGVQQSESDEVRKTFETPTPFTQNAFAITPATKSRPIAVVFVKDIQEQYLAPYVVGGPRSLGSKRAMLVPIAAGVNQYGNLPRNKLQQLKGKPNVFIGTVKTRGGRRIGGVWERAAPVKAGKRHKGVVQPKRPLKLLIEFAETTPAPKRLGFYERAQAYLRANATREFEAAMRKALSTAR